MYAIRSYYALASMVLKLPVYDTQCGAKLFSNSIASQIFNKPFISKWLFDIELFSRAIILYGRQAIKETVVEIPLNEWEDKAGSKIKTTYFIKAETTPAVPEEAEAPDTADVWRNNFV